MNLLDLVNRDPHPAPWSEGDNIPWHEPGFSERMLREHLSQDRVGPSRWFPKIDRHVAWIHEAVLDGVESSVLDLGCGPGLYSSRLARLGHSCRGVDYSPASIAYAKEDASAEGLDCEYVLADMRQADYGTGFDMAMLIYGELNVFAPADARLILRKAYAALRPGGRLLLEPHPYDVIRRMSEGPPTWYASKGGLFSSSPHLVLTDSDWDERSEAVTIRRYLVGATTGNVTRYAQSMQAYDQDGYRDLLAECGFKLVATYLSLLGKADPDQPDLMVLVAHKAGVE